MTQCGGVLRRRRAEAAEADWQAAEAEAARLLALIRAYCRENVGLEVTETGRALLAVAGQGVSTSEPEPPEYQRTNDEEC